MKRRTLIVIALVAAGLTACSSPPPAPVVVVSPIRVRVSDGSMVVFGDLAGRAGDDVQSTTLTTESISGIEPAASK